MRPYGQKKVYGKYITRTVRYKSAGKIHVRTLVKNRKKDRPTRLYLLIEE